MYDSHCHLHDPRMRADVDAYVQRAMAAGVTDVLLAGVDPDGWQDEIALHARHPQLHVSFGVHPQVVGEGAHAMVDALEDLLRSTRPCAIGEIGLDGLEQNAGTLGLQEEIFRRQLAIARAHRLPVALHVLRAHPRALEVLRDDGVPYGGVLHSCSASADLVKKYLALGLSISFAGAIVDDKARRIRDAAKVVPLDRLLVETDAPDQTPVTKRPLRNEPAFLVEIVAALAQIRGEGEEVVARVTSDNARRLFG